eukprot:1416806-Prymnesium_polylepis.1
MAAVSLTAKTFLEKATKLQEMDVEPKGSCWIFAAISNIADAIENRKAPSCRDKLLDHYLRREAVSLEAHAQASASRVLVPTQGARRSKTPQVGMQPDGGWAGTFAFDYLVM